MAQSAQPICADMSRLNLRPSSDRNSYSIPSQTLELSISCSDLKASGANKPNSVVIIYMQEPGSKEYKECGRTEPVMHHTSPEFAKKHRVEHFFEESAENMKFIVYNYDSATEDPSEQDILGEAIAAIGDICKAPQNLCVLELRNQTDTQGKITIRSEVPDDCRDVAFMSWERKKANKSQGLFTKKQWLKLKLSRINEDGSFTVCLKSDPKKDAWTDLEVPVQLLCNADYGRTIRIEVFETNREKEDIALIGYFDTWLNKLKNGPGKKNTYECKKSIQNGDKTSWEKTGTLSLIEFKIKPQHTFIDYVREGMEMSFVVAIDFTSSNGKPADPESLHYLHPHRLNEYQLAIQGVGYVLEKYDTDMKFPSFGFGARLPPTNRVSHKFPINFSEDPNCIGVDGILEAYRNCVNGLDVHGPTNFAPIVRHVSDEAKSVKGASNYYVLLIVTDGVYTDRDATMEAIVEAAKYPMSIVIVGVGKENFDRMVELDGDNVRVSYDDEEAERDIVQFVPLRDHISKDGSKIMSRGRFTNRVLEEIPDQIVEYMKKRNFTPGMGTAPPEYHLH